LVVDDLVQLKKLKQQRLLTYKKVDMDKARVEVATMTVDMVVETQMQMLAVVASVEVAPEVIQDQQEKRVDNMILLTMTQDGGKIWQCIAH
jgi:hypothetical protein